MQRPTLSPPILHSFRRFTTESLESAGLLYPGILKRRQTGFFVRCLQELLTLHGFCLSIDGQFGMATQWALQRFQEQEEISPTGILEDNTWRLLTRPFAESMQFFPFPMIPSINCSLQSLTLKYALGFLLKGASELPQNRGPWVRLFMNGFDGSTYPWCAGFVSFCIRLAIHSFSSDPMQTEMKFWFTNESFSCDRIAQWATKNGHLLRSPDPTILVPGTIFLVYKGNNDWTHTGFVVSVAPSGNVIETVEGNTNFSGSREGIAVLRRFRSTKNLHYVPCYGPL